MPSSWELEVDSCSIVARGLESVWRGSSRLADVSTPMVRWDAEG